MNIYASYACNFRCRFCTIYKKSGGLVDLDWAENELSKRPELCSNINILGGEPSILPEAYQERLIDICMEAAGEPPYLITNLYKKSPFLRKCRPIVSYDFRLREHHHTVLQNILSMEQEFSLSTVLTSYLVEQVGAEKYLRFIHSLPNCTRADLDIYYKSKDAEEDFTPDNEKLLGFVSAVMKSDKVNLAPLSAMRSNIDSSVDNVSDYLAFMPERKYGVRFDYRNGTFAEFDSYEAAMAFYKKRTSDENCKMCEFRDSCWYPHSDDVCHGNKPMLEMFKQYVLSSDRQTLYRK